MVEPKTKKTEQSVEEFIAGVDEKRRADCQTLIDLMREVTEDEPAMWGPSIVGFGSYRYKYASGREGNWPLTGFSPRKQNLTLYIMSGFDAYDALLGKLGKHTTGKSCLYVKKLDDVDMAALRELVEQSVAHMRSSSS
jgi:hypothetical protein